jgi:hypothetical protein
MRKLRDVFRCRMVGIGVTQIVLYLVVNDVQTAWDLLAA